MGVMRYVFSVGVIMIALWMGGFFTKEKQPPVMEDGFWGKGKITRDKDTSIRPFEVAIPDFGLRDLHTRLNHSRFGEDLEETDFSYGFQVETMKTVLTYWKEKYNWRAQEKLINQFPQFKTRIEGIDIHFLNVPASEPGPVPRPLLLVHGWPGSVWEFYKMIPLLSAQGFTIICPSIPGYGFSEAPHQQGFDPSDAARIFGKLMARLGFTEYYVQGGDWGSLITTIMAQAYPKNVLGAHTNFVTSGGLSVSNIIRNIFAQAFPSLFLSQEQRDVGIRMHSFLELLPETGYFHIQATKPDTVGIALNDSPVGLAAYILEKFSTWTNAAYKERKDGGLTEMYTLDELLTNVMIYWFSGCAQSSMRFYKENILSETVQQFDAAPVLVPSGLANFPNELVFVPQSIAKGKYKQIVQYTNMPAGGHFAAFEQPELLAKDIISFVEKVEQLQVEVERK